MNKNYLWTKLKARLQLIRTTPGANFNWLFLAGGPGLGSDSLNPLTQLLRLPGSMWNLDLPGDGSNLTTDDSQHFSHWSEALVEAVGALDHVILVAHSTGGMYALSTPALSKILVGLVLMDSAPDASWQKSFMQHVNKNPIKDSKNLQTKYGKKPNNDLLKKITIASAQYSFTKKGISKGVSLLKSLPFNYKTCEWSGKHFDQKYKAKWIPNTTPTLILAGEKDQIIPLDFFIESKKFQRKNIMIRNIKNAGHFPWIENPKQTVKVFIEYYQFLSKKIGDKRRASRK